MNQLLLLAKKERKKTGEGGGGELGSYNNKLKNSNSPERHEKITTFQL